MVRKKSNSFRKLKPFAPSGKLLMIERNRSLQSPVKITASIKAPIAGSTVTSPQCTSTSIIKTQQFESKKRKMRPGIKAIREIKKFQSNTSLLIPKTSFSRVVHEVMQSSFGKMDYRFSMMAMQALQEATEMAIVNLLEVANLCCIHAKRITLSPSDIRLTRRAFGLGHPVND